MNLHNDFDIVFYKNYYNDLQHMTNDELIHHYLNHGIYENRIYKNNNNFNIISYLKEQRDIYGDLTFLTDDELVKYCIKYNKIKELPIDFDIDFYRNYYQDLQNMTSIELINHYINHGINENRIYKKTNSEMKTRYISLGSWCGTAWSLRQNALNDCDKQLPFDFIRSRFDGIIDCFENNFENYLPKKIEVDIIENYEYNNFSLRGKYFGFFHHDLRNPETIEALNRRIKRLDDYLKNNNEKIIFIRTILNKNYEEDINLGIKFTNIINNKYPLLQFLLIFVISEQPETKYYKNISNNIFVFTVDDIDHNWTYIKDKYKKIYDYISEHDLFNNIPESNDLIINEIKGLSGEEKVQPFRDDN
jgi:hypothetical protein